MISYFEYYRSLYKSSKLPDEVAAFLEDAFGASSSSSDLVSPKKSSAGAGLLLGSFLSGLLLELGAAE
jgi:hypothetical protein